ncbi:hypothetical protein [Agrobacterium vitis]|nr:hypothetical protein [Agrobacterium vitis]MUO70066.1 hypothetical protein [Agrobacterium vitis]
MKAEAIDAYHWLRGYPDAADALRWLLDNDQNRHRAIGEKAIGVLPSDISGFRSMLDTRHNQQQEEIRKLRDIAYHLGNGCAPGNIDLLEMIANEIDCGRDCEHGSTEWDTNAFNCRKIDEGTCAGTNAEELRQLAKAFRNRLELASKPGTAPAPSFAQQFARPIIEFHVETVEAKDEPLRCPICDIAFQSKDICASDYNMGTCHADCLEGSPVVDLDTGDPLPGGKINTFLFGDDEEKRAAK